MDPQDPSSPSPNTPPSPMPGPDSTANAAAAAPDPQGSARAQPESAAQPTPSGAGAGTIERSLERLVRELLHDRRAERRWRIFFRLAWLGLAAIVVWTLGMQRGHSNAPSGTHTALVEVKGEIAADTEASAEQLIAGLRNAFSDQGARGVVIRINSPGGSPVQAGIVHDEIRRLKALHKKKVYAVVDEMCASGAYYIAVAADEIFVDKASLVGSIGVLMDGFGVSGLMDKLGI